MFFEHAPIHQDARNYWTHKTLQQFFVLRKLLMMTTAASASMLIPPISAVQTQESTLAASVYKWRWREWSDFQIDERPLECFLILCDMWHVNVESIRSTESINAVCCFFLEIDFWRHRFPSKSTGIWSHPGYYIQDSEVLTFFSIVWINFRWPAVVYRAKGK